MTRRDMRANFQSRKKWRCCGDYFARRMVDVLLSQDLGYTVVMQLLNHTTWWLTFACLLPAFACEPDDGVDQGAILLPSPTQSADAGVSVVVADSGAVDRPATSADDELDESVLAPQSEAGVVEVTEENSCATADVQVVVPDVTLHFLVDISGSMDGQLIDRFQKWDPLKDALKSFFRAEMSQGLDASVHLFPRPLAEDTEAERDLRCLVESYDEPALATAALPNGDVFSDFIDSLDPVGETPTAPALRGVLQHASAALDNNPNGRAAVLLVSDGNPQGCETLIPTNTVNGASAEVATYAEQIPTYVIGVGDSLERLNQIAEAGGTESAVIVGITEPDQTSSQILERLEEIRSEVASCDVPIPEAPDGRRLEAGWVAAELLTAEGEPTPLAYDPDCTGDLGFRYDSLAQPENIRLCQSACAEVRKDDTSLNVLFGCSVIVPELR